MAFVKFQNNAKDPEGQQLSWGRSDLDGMPFRGVAVPLRDDEFEEYTETAIDAYAKTFDMSQAADVIEYRKILEGVTNHWYQLLYRTYRWVELKDGNVYMKVYIEWSIPHKELSPRFKNTVNSPAINLGVNGNGNGIPGLH